MSTVRVYLSGNPVHDRVLEAFYEGCPEEKTLARNFEYEPSDIAVVFGVFKSKVPQSFPRGRVFSQQRSLRKDVVVLETGYINRGDGINHHFAAGFNGLNGRADFRNDGMAGDRAGLLNIEMKAPKDGSFILLCGQVPWDASVEGSDHIAWLGEIAANLMRITRRPIVFRPHPLAKLPPIQGCFYSEGPLVDYLERAHAVVTYNSNTGVDAVLAGKHVFAFDEGSMVWEIANKDVAEIESAKLPDRSQWLNDIAYAQWTPGEMAEGLAWRHLFRK